MLPRGIFFGARLSVCITVGVSVGVWVFLFATELETEMGFTDDCYTDGRDPSVSPSVLFSPTDFIAVTDGINPSVKLDNVVVFVNYKERRQRLRENLKYMSCLVGYLDIISKTFH
jgi:hypothetical protein